MEIDKITGLIAAPVVPFSSDGSVLYDSIEPYANLLNRNGVVGVFVNGTTGESLNLSLQERLKIAEKWVEVSPSELKIIVHIGAPSVNDSVALAKHAQEIGAFAVGSMPPIFFKPGSVSQLISHMAIEAAAAPDLPYFFYHIPSLTGVNFPVLDIFSQADEVIPNFAGVKFTFEALADALSCMKFKDSKYNVLFGRDEMFLSGYMLGMKGAVGSTYNIAAPLYNDIMTYCDAKDIESAIENQMRSISLIREMAVGGKFFASLKAILGFLGVEAGNTRSPLPRMDQKEVASLKSRLESIGFFDYACK
jgi:N-acetylneuraminate lyase